MKRAAAWLIAGLAIAACGIRSPPRPPLQDSPQPVGEMLDLDAGFTDDAGTR